MTRNRRNIPLTLALLALAAILATGASAPAILNQVNAPDSPPSASAPSANSAAAGPLLEPCGDIVNIITCRTGGCQTLPDGKKKSFNIYQWNIFENGNRVGPYLAPSSTGVTCRPTCYNSCMP